MVRLGRDPAGEKIEGRARAAETMGAVVQTYLAQARMRIKPRSYVEVARHLTVYDVTPHFAAIGELAQADASNGKLGLCNRRF